MTPCNQANDCEGTGIWEFSIAEGESEQQFCRCLHGRVLASHEAWETWNSHPSPDTYQAWVWRHQEALSAFDRLNGVCDEARADAVRAGRPSSQAARETVQSGSGAASAPVGTPLGRWLHDSGLYVEREMMLIETCRARGSRPRGGRKAGLSWMKPLRPHSGIVAFIRWILRRPPQAVTPRRCSW